MKKNEKEKAHRLVTVRLTEEEFSKLSEQAKKEKISKGAVIKKALDAYYESESKGADTKELESRLEEMNRRYIAIVNRLNVITKQLEHLRETKHGK